MSFTIRRRRGFLFEEQPGEVHVGGLGDLDVAIGAQHYAYFHLVQTLHQAGFVSAGEAVDFRGCAKARISSS